MTLNSGDIHDRNIATTFRILDSNGSGTITWEDFTRIRDQICGQFGIVLDSPDGQRMEQAYRDWWEQLRTDLDTDGNGQITMAEFAAAYTEGDARRFFDEQLGRIVHLVGEIMDADHDGFITEPEYLALLAVADSDRQVAVEAFQQMDADGDGKLSLAEFEAGIRAVMLSNDPSTPGIGMLDPS
jgi:Ca2+-binding EF-hand superfamily protein